MKKFATYERIKVLSIWVIIRLRIENQLPCLDTPELNRVSERFNQTLQGKIKSIMFYSKLPSTM